MTDLTTLADRVEAGTADEQRALLEAAWHVVRPEPPRSWKPMPIQEAIEHPVHSVAVRAHSDWRSAFAGYQAKLAADAYVDAAMMLVPSDWSWSITGTGYAEVRHPRFRARDKDGRAATPALALAAAAFRAHASEAAHG